MMHTRTVLVLGAGASVPYEFPSGSELLDEVRSTQLENLKQMLSWVAASDVRGFHNAMRGTLERSIDAALETLPAPIVEAGKAYMAYRLLACEYQMRTSLGKYPRRWHEFLWSALNLQSLEGFRSSPVTLVSYNYDRSIEYAILLALQVRFPGKTTREYIDAMEGIEPIHLHGQLGDMLADTSHPYFVPFGGSDEFGPYQHEIVRAAESIQIVHEPDPHAKQFIDAQNSIGVAERIIFLGFSYARNNVERLKLQNCLDKNAAVFLCVRGFTKPEVLHHVRPQFSPWNPQVENVGDVGEDIVDFLRQRPGALA